MDISMWRSILFILSLLILSAPVQSSAWAALEIDSLTLAGETGLRTDQFDWNIAGSFSGENPNIFSELVWDDLQIMHFGLRTELEISSPSKPWLKTQVRGEVGYGSIFSGSVQDSDYEGDNRTLEFSRTNNAADQGYVLDLSFGVGQKFSFLQEKLNLLPLLGYSYHRQHLKLLNGYQTIPAEGPFPGLNTRYEANWWGPWAGVELSWKANERLLFRGLTEYHLADFFADADWNLRNDFAHPLSFEHRSDGSGWIHELGLEVRLRERWRLSLAGIWQSWVTGAGTDLVFLADGTRQLTRLNQVHWSSTSIQLGLSFQY